MRFLTLLTGFASVVFGMWYVRRSFGQESDEFERKNTLSWLFLALFPVLLIFAFFPGSEAAGKVIGFSVGGAFAAYVLLFLLGTRRSAAAKTLDDVKRHLAARETEIQGLTNQAKRPKVVGETRKILYKVKECPSKRIGVVTGDLNRVTFIPIWVNSENTNMQMSRFFENTVSATIRYCGSRKDDLGNVVEDCIANELRAKMGTATTVPPGHVLVTGPGELAGSHNVKQVYHAASVQGQQSVGYRQIADVASCVRNALAMAEREPWAVEEPRSIIFPLLGANVGGGELEATIEALFTAAIDHFACQTGGSALDVVWFLAYTDRELDTFTRFLDNEPRVGREVAAA